MDPQETTKRLVSIGSVSPSGHGESEVAEKIVRQFRELGMDSKTISMRDGRKLAFAIIRGKGSTALLLFGHTDTVGVEDYGALSGVAFDPDGLRRALKKEGLERAAIRDLDSGKWLAGRGALDMKSGIAVELDVMSRLKKRRGFDGTVVFLGTPDEEHNSAGMMEGVKFLDSLSRKEGLDFMGAINADYTAPRFPGDGSRYAYLGTIGKLLPSFYAVGEATHVGSAFEGLDANLLSSELTRLIDLNPDLCDSAGGEVTVPPVLLKQEDLKTGYNVQTAFAARQYFNFFTHGMTPKEVLREMEQKARGAAGNVSETLARNYSGYLKRQGGGPHPAKRRAGKTQVIAYSKVRAFASRRIGRTRVEKLIKKICTGESEQRQMSLKIVEALWNHSGLKGPAIVVYFSPPYYPPSFITEGEAGRNDFVKSAIGVSGAFGLTVRKFYPYISDASYLRLANGGADGLGENLPQWGVGYSLPVDEMERLNIPVVNLGPWGRDAHKRTERVYMPYSFGTLPKIIEKTIRKTFV